MDTEVRRSNLFAGIFRFGPTLGQVKCIMNATWCAPETPDLISRGYFPILFGLSESHHLLPALAHSLSIMLAVAVGRSAAPPFARSRARGKFPSGKEGWREKSSRRASATAFLLPL